MIYLGLIINSNINSIADLDLVIYFIFNSLVIPLPITIDFNFITFITILYIFMEPVLSIIYFPIIAIIMNHP